MTMLIPAAIILVMIIDVVLIILYSRPEKIGLLISEIMKLISSLKARMRRSPVSGDKLSDVRQARLEAERQAEEQAAERAKAEEAAEAERRRRIEAEQELERLRSSKR